MTKYYLVVWRLYGDYCPVFMSEDESAAERAAELLAAAHDCKSTGCQWVTPDSRPGDKVAGYITVITPEDTKSLLEDLETRFFLRSIEYRKAQRKDGQS